MFVFRCIALKFAAICNLFIAGSKVRNVLVVLSKRHADLF